MHTLRLAALALACHLLAVAGSAQTYVEIRQDATFYNFRTTNGVPLSDTPGTPIGSDGRGPTTASQTALGQTVNPATAGQFQSVISFGGVGAPASAAALNPSLSYAANATAIGLPVARSNNVVVLVLKAARVGSPFLNRSISFQFGSIIPVPAVDVAGATLTNPLPTAYWLPEPFSTNDHAGAAYYWSEHAKAVFSIQPGPVNIVWRKAVPEVLATGTPAGFVANVTHYRDGANFYPLYPVRYIASGSAVKPPQQMYWTEGVFADTGKPVNVPAARVSTVNVVYNNNFPARVDKAYVAEGQTFITDQTNLLQEVRTLWHDSAQKQVFAYNVEGRVFVELLGDTRPDGRTKQHLGFEIVDVIKRANPADVTTELGERLTAFADGRDDSALFPEPILNLAPQTFNYQQTIGETDRPIYYATRETVNQNDVLVHWMQVGVQSIRWPSRFVRYRQVWPADVARYSHYVRPLVATDAEARLTAVPLPNENVPTIDYQDPFDRPRANLTEQFALYTFLDPTVPAHRTLLRFTSGEEVRFERVFSWLDVNLKSPARFSDSVATNLTTWNPNTSSFDWAAIEASAPRVINQAVEVGSRIPAPGGELGAAGGSYLAGYILQTNGNSFHPGAYKDPFGSGFEAANLGAIIPVNAIPGAHALEVWWFRKNAPDLAKGFKIIYWPAVIGRYTIQWPANPPEIVLASNDGSGGLGSLEAKGSIYTQNDPTLPGYNPNEEHALMLGGQAFALRDDLNLTANTLPAVLSGVGATYSSEPFVLLDFSGSDGRPQMTAFKVLREKPADGILFDYITEAGKILQAPMPLPFLAPPVEYQTNLTADATNIVRINYNVEPAANGGDLPPGWNAGSDGSGPNAHYQGFTYRDRKNSFWVYRGLHAGLPKLAAGSYAAAADLFLPLTDVAAVLGQPFTNHVHVSRQPETLVMTSLTGLPAGVMIDGLTVTGNPTTAGTNLVSLRITDSGDGSVVTNSCTLRVSSNGVMTTQGPLVIDSTNGFTGTITTFVGRPPYLARSAEPTNSFTMRFYYLTQDGFAWPGQAAPPAVGAIVPYLRPVDGAGNPIGAPGAKSTPALDIVYRPTWPGFTPTLAPGQTLTVPTLGLPAVRGQTSLQILYQQSIGTNFATKTPSVRLHDATREKSFALQTNSALGLGQLPAGVRVESYQGKTFFPNLPPHLAQRFFFAPSRGAKGHLVFKGEFKDEPLGEKYLLLNVLGTADLATVKALCPGTEADKSKWNSAIDRLAATVETFYENPAVPGTFIANTNLTRAVGATNLVEITDDDTAKDSYALSAAGPGTGFITLIAGNGAAFTPAGEPVSVLVLRVGGPLYLGDVKVLPSANPLNELITFQHTGDLAARTAEYEYEWRIAPPVDGLPLRVNAENPAMTGWTSLANALDVPRYTLGGAGIQVLVDNYITLRYRPKNPLHPLVDQWSAWTVPALAEGWIKRVLAGINPFSQRVTDLFNNTVNTDASILAQAGKRWEGDVALNLESINNYGLIEIYETVLRRGKSLSIDAGINFGPANDALLLAAGYLNDLYMMHGNEAYADAANPTIGIGSKDQTYGEVATALFAFKGQMPTLLAEELALLRGRDEFLQPGTGLAPVYNRLVWNYTRGIDSGEVIYALNYNILDQDGNGSIGAADAAKLYPQGHGDAYGHYLTAMKGYYSLLMDTDFDWVPRIEAVNILGKAVSVDYQDERKFAAAAAAVARTGRQIFDLTWRQDYQSGQGNGWEHFAATRSSATRTRNWGMDHWAARTGQGAYVNWIVGNAILPDVDPDPTHEGIQKVDRRTVPELQELPSVVDALQIAMDNAESGLTPLGLPETSIPFDLNPNPIVGSSPQTHFEQVNERAKATLRNALVAFDEAKDVTRLMRSEQDSLADFQATVAKQEFAYTNTLIGLYGTPYPDDIGPGVTYKQGYAGPDLIHYMYVQEQLSIDGSATAARGAIHYDFYVQKELVPAALNYEQILADEARFGEDLEGVRLLKPLRLSYTLNEFLFPVKPESWTGRRQSPGELQSAVDKVLQARAAILFAHDDFEQSLQNMERQLDVFRSRIKARNTIETANDVILVRDQIFKSIEDVIAIAISANRLVKDAKTAIKAAVIEGFPKFMIAGTAFGADAFSAARASQEGLYGGILSLYNTKDVIKATLIVAAKRALRELGTILHEHVIEPALWDLEDIEGLHELEQTFAEIEPTLQTFAQRDNELQAAQQRLDALMAEGERLQTEREVFRQRAAAVIQGFRTRDAAFRIFRNEKLERYKTLFDLAARYAFMSAQAYDYETGQLGTTAGKDFVSRIIRSRALGVMKDGEPQYAGSNTGDPGLSSALAEMSADWLVLKGRLGFNNPDAYGTTVSLRMEKLRILPSSDGDPNWTDVLQRGRKANLLDDPDVKRQCLQIDPGTGLPVPGIILEFSTTIENGYNLFGQPAAAGDHGFSPASFATKIFAAGIALEGYQGMDNPVANSSAVGGAGGTSPTDPTVSFLDPNALFATPYIYLIPVGVDSMRSPPLGDTSTIRTWSVDDVTIPLPFNLGASDFSTRQLWQSGNSLTEQLFSTRKHQPFRPVPTAAAFSSGIYTGSGGLQRSQFTNSRLIGRSVWNSKWKIVIPGQTLLNNPDEGLDRFIRTVKDVKLHFVTYSYSGN